MHGDILRNYIFRFFTGKGITIVPEEIASLFHFPDPRWNVTPQIAWQKFKTSEAPSNLPSSGVMIGHNVFRGERKPVRISDADRFRHFYTIGQTGSGKSTTLKSMIIQDIQNGKGVCVMDPHGDLAESVIKFVPKERAEDVIYFNPSDIERPLGLNMLEARTNDEKEAVASDTLAMMIKLYGEEIFSPRLQDYFRNGVLTLMDDPAGGALTDIVNLFVQPKFQAEKRKHVQNPIVRNWWDATFDAMGDAEKQEMIPYFAAKFSSFISNSMMRNIIGQSRSAFDFSKAMNEGKIILVNLSKGEMGEFNSRLLGMIIVAKIQMGAFARASQPEKERVPFYFYIDEFQNYVTEAIESILSEARKYRLSLNIAHQYIDQLESSGGMSGGGSDKVKKAVFGNIGSMAALKVGAADAEYLAKEFAPIFSESNLNSFDQFRGCAKLSIDGQQSRPFSFEVLKPWEAEWTEDEKIANAIKELSRLKYGRDRKEIDREILGRLGANGKKEKTLAEKIEELQNSE